MAKARKAARMIYRTCEVAQDKLHKVMDSLKHEIQKVVEGARDKIYKAMEELNMAIPISSMTEGGDWCGHGPSFIH